MSKGVLKFNLPEEQEEFRTAQDGGKWRSVVFEVNQHLRNRLKHEELSEPERAALQDVRDRIHELLREEDLNLG